MPLCLSDTPVSKKTNKQTLHKSTTKRKRTTQTQRSNAWESRKSAPGQVHLGEEECQKSQTHSITWKAHKERVKPAALYGICAHHSLFFQGLCGKAHSFSSSTQSGNESGTVSHWEVLVQVQAKCPALNRFYWGVKRKEHESEQRNALYQRS